jgi:hypothetical protein
MDLLNELYISKSFCWLGKSLDKCFDCKYCRAKPKQDNKEWSILPTRINPNFTNLPVVINLFYGDPLLQIENTKKYLNLLEEENHQAPVIIITKGDLRHLGELSYNLNLHIALSTIGKESWVDSIGHKNFIKNLDYIKSNTNNNIKFSCEFRPIMYQVNDDIETIDNLFKLCAEYNLPIGYSGLQGSKDLIEYWKENNINLKPFPNYDFTIKKPISIECENILKECSQKYNVPIFKKTSCLISYNHDMERDYNAHYYRPNELNCKDCVMKDRCFKFKESQSKNIESIKNIIPFDFTIEYKTNHKCLLHDTCPHPHNDCTNITGNLINIKQKVTTADVRVIKWLTGYTVIAEFEESNYLSKEWKLQ